MAIPFLRVSRIKGGKSWHFKGLPGKESSAFTLGEVLAVVCIILVICSLIVPIAKKSLDAGNRARCVTNLRTLSAGLLSYAQDNDGELPPSYSDPAGTYKVKGFWAGILFHAGYIPSPDVCFCPASTKKFWKESNFQKGLNYNSSQSAWGYCSYGANRIGLMPTTSDSGRVVRIGKINRPASTLLLVESAYPKYAKSDGRDGWYWLNAASVSPVVQALKNDTSPPSEPGPGTRHGQNLPIAFCDGHVEVTNILTSPVSTFSKTSDEPWCEGVYTK